MITYTYTLKQLGTDNKDDVKKNWILPGGMPPPGMPHPGMHNPGGGQ